METVSVSLWLVAVVAVRQMNRVLVWQMKPLNVCSGENLERNKN